MQAALRDRRQPAGNPMTDSTTSYLQEIGTIPRLTRDQELAIGKQIAEGDERALRRMVEANLRLVVSIAKRYRNEHLPLLDLIQEGNLGLIHAARKYEYQQGNRFATYAVWWIRQAVGRAVEKQPEIGRVPHSARTMAQRNRNEQQPGTAAEQVTMLEHNGTLEWSRQSRQMVSLDQPVDQHEGLGLADILEDRQAIAPAEAADEAVLRDSVHALVGDLPERERRVVELRFGLCDGTARTMREVAAIMDLSHERVRQLEAQALGRLRQRAGVDHLRCYLR